MSQSSGDEAAETDEMMPDAGIRDVAAAITSADTLPFFMEEIKEDIDQAAREFEEFKETFEKQMAKKIKNKKNAHDLLLKQKGL